MFDALSPRTALPITISLSQLSHSTNRNFIASSASSSKYICERKVIDLTESSIFFYVAHTCPYRSFVVFKQRTRLFKFFLLFCINSDFLFLRKNRNIFCFCELAIKKESLEINKLSISRATNHHSIGNKWTFAI